jgi:hypothetical protein
MQWQDSGLKTEQCKHSLRQHFDSFWTLCSGRTLGHPGIQVRDVAKKLGYLTLVFLARTDLHTYIPSRAPWVMRCPGSHNYDAGAFKRIFYSTREFIMRKAAVAYVACTYRFIRLKMLVRGMLNFELHEALLLPSQQCIQSTPLIMPGHFQRQGLALHILEEGPLSFSS